MFMWGRYTLIGVLISACVLGVYFLATSREGSDGDEVAIVNGASISYDDIAVDPRLSEFALPSGVSEAETEIETRAREMRLLRGRVRKIIFDEKVAELNLAASDEEVDFRVEEIFRKTEMTKDEANTMCEEIKLVHEALVEWHNDRERADRIYEEKLAGSSISEDQWKLFQICCDTPEKLRTMVVPKTIEDMKKNSRESAAKDVLYSKLMNVITADVSVTSSEIEQAYAAEYASSPESPPLDEVRSVLEGTLLAKKKDDAMRLWWAEQYKKADIEVKDPRFGDFAKLLMSGGIPQRE